MLPASWGAMRDGVSSKDWTSVRHAYGAAADLPALFETLASARGALWDDAFGTLGNLINHQGSVYDASVAAVPLLVQLLDKGDAAHSRELLHLIGNLGLSYAYDYYRYAFWFVDEATAANDRAPAPEPPIAARARAAIAAHTPEFLELLGEPDPEIVCSAARVLQLSRSEGPAIRNAVIEVLPRTVDPRARAALLYLELTACDPDQRRARARARLQIESAPEPRLVAHLATHCHPPSRWTIDEIDAFSVDYMAAGVMPQRLQDRFARRSLHNLLGSDLSTHVQFWTHQLQAPRPELQIEALHAVAELDAQWRHAAERTEHEVATRLQGPDHEVRFLAANTLGRFATRSEPVIAALRLAHNADDDHLVRIAAGLALGSELTDAETVGLYRLSLSTPPPIQRRMLDLPERSLALLGPKGGELLPELIEALHALTEAARDGDQRGGSVAPWSSAARELVAAVGRFGPRAEPAVDALVALLEAGYPEQAVLAALEGIGPRSLAALPTIADRCEPFRVDLFQAALSERSPATENVRARPMVDAQFVLRLGAFGARARGLGPDLERFVDKRLPLHAQYAVATAILEIGYDSSPAVDTLFTGLRAQPLQRGYSIDWARAIRALVAAHTNLEPIRTDLVAIAYSQQRALPDRQADTSLQHAALEALRSAGAA